MDLSIVIVSYDCLEYLRNCLSSFYQTIPHSKISFELIVVDNASKDGTPSMILKEFPSVKLIQNKENLGFAKANNQGIKISKGKYILLLNPDTQVLPKSIEYLFDFMEKNKDVAIVGPKLLNPDKGLQISAYYNSPNLLNCFYEIILFDRFMELFFPRVYYPFKFMLNKEECQKAKEVSAILGAAFFFRKSLLEKISFLDENFHLYREETDFCKRAKKAGFKIYYLPKSSIVHFFGGVTKGSLYEKTSRVLESRYLFHQKHYGPFSTLLLKTIDFLGSIFSLVFLFLVYGFLFLIPHFLTKKRKKMILDLICFRINLILFRLKRLLTFLSRTQIKS